MKINFDTLKFSRTRILELIDGLTTEQLNKIPTGLNTNMIWNIGHILSVQQIFMYKRTGLSFSIKAEIVEKYKSGAAVKTDIDKEEIDYLSKLLLKTIEELQIDYNNKRFTKFDSFTTKRGVEIKTVEDAISFHTFHEGVHLGWLWTISKLV